VVVLDGPFGVSGGTANGWCPKRGVAHTEHPKLGRQTIKIQADAVEVGTGGASGQGRSHSILCGCNSRRRFLGGLAQALSFDVCDLPKARSAFDVDRNLSWSLWEIADPKPRDLRQPVSIIGNILSCAIRDLLHAATRVL